MPGGSTLGAATRITPTTAQMEDAARTAQPVIEPDGSHTQFQIIGADSQISQVVCAQMAVKAKERGYFAGYLVPMAALVVIGATELGHVYGALNSEAE